MSKGREQDQSIRQECIHSQQACAWARIHDAGHPVCRNGDKAESLANPRNRPIDRAERDMLSLGRRIRGLAELHAG